MILRFRQCSRATRKFRRILSDYAKFRKVNICTTNLGALVLGSIEAKCLQVNVRFAASTRLAQFCTAERTA